MTLVTGHQMQALVWMHCSACRYYLRAMRHGTETMDLTLHALMDGHGSRLGVIPRQFPMSLQGIQMQTRREHRIRRAGLLMLALAARRLRSLPFCLRALLGLTPLHLHLPTQGYQPSLRALRHRVVGLRLHRQCPRILCPIFTSINQCSLRPSLRKITPQ